MSDLAVSALASEPLPLTGQPVGLPVDARPSPRPGPVTLQGHHGRVERLAPQHSDSLWEHVKDAGAIWTYIANSGPFAGKAAFDAWLARRIAAEDPYAYAIVDRDDRVIGSATLMSIRPDMRVIEVGSIVYSPTLQRTPLGTETQYLLARYAIETLRYRRYEWKCDALNAPSRRAAWRYGFVFEGIFRQHMISNGRNRDTAWFSITDGEWPARKRAFETWLAPDNFSADGRQKRSLTALNAGAHAT
jgi:RimJ/RimL family protein N-acetyltransferase